VHDSLDPVSMPANTVASQRAEAPAARLRGRPVLLATDGSAEARAAARVVAALASEREAVPHVVRVLDVSAYPVPTPLPSVIAAADALVGRALREADADALRAELGRELGAKVDWPAYLGLGSPAGVVVHEAEHIGAELIVMGIRRHDFVERVLRDETTLTVMRRAHCPVLGVAPTLAGLPRRALVGIDFGRAGVRAARTALALLHPAGTMVLAYVQPPHPPHEFRREDAEGAEIVRTLGIDAAFRRLATELAAEAGVSVEPAVVDCRPGVGTVGELLALGDRVAADLLAVGSQRHRRIDRLLLGSVTTELARDGRHSLLVVPPHDEPAAPHP
jgi:nucleotide-binding universal stress UspA family protein